MTIADWYNAVEALFWFALAGVVAIYGGRTAGFTRRTRIAMPVLLAAFGVSDLIELQTGAWWRPPGLLVLKGACLIGLIACVYSVYGRRRRA
jgi:hypothetical protein